MVDTNKHEDGRESETSQDMVDSGAETHDLPGHEASRLLAMYARLFDAICDGRRFEPCIDDLLALADVRGLHGRRRPTLA